MSSEPSKGADKNKNTRILNNVKMDFENRSG